MIVRKLSLGSLRIFSRWCFRWLIGCWVLISADTTCMLSPGDLAKQECYLLAAGWKKDFSVWRVQLEREQISPFYRDGSFSFPCIQLSVWNLGVSAFFKSIFIYYIFLFSFFFFSVHYKYHQRYSWKRNDSCTSTESTASNLKSKLSSSCDVLHSSVKYSPQLQKPFS